ncbi:MAG: amino acid adenylation domain-containing protein [Pseudomonadota bacterium]
MSQLIDRAADADPGAEAMSDCRLKLSYADLVERANQLAHLLADEGVSRGDRVGIFLPRGLDTAIAVYGILKAGAAFVPIDPRVPPGGLQQLTRNCGIRHLVAHNSLVPTVESALQEKTPVECIVGTDVTLPGIRSRSWRDLEVYDAGAAPNRRVLDDDLAYIMYSSGSTGRPKGIKHTHRSGLAYAELSVETYGVTRADRIGNHSPLHFDMSTFGYFSGPYAGATTIIIPEAYTKVVASLSQLIESERMTIWYSVPLALIQLLLRGVIETRDLSSLRWVLFGGEPFPPDHLRELMRKLPGTRFSNVYGPAETNQCAFYHVPDATDPTSEAAQGAPIPIGQIWNNTEGLLVDEDDQPIHGSEPGELLVRSATMMRGYWARPDLDKRSFYTLRADDGDLDHTFYRTGDLVRRRDDGQLMFLGRKDRQLKVRGYRVELDDIEHLLGSHSSVEEAAVFPVREDDGTRRIEAAVTLRDHSDVDVASLRDFLQRVLSWYALPKNITIVDALPRTGLL